MENKENHELRLIRKSFGDEMKRFCIHNFSNILNASLNIRKLENKEIYLLYDTLRKYFQPSSELIKDILKNEKTTNDFIDLIKLEHEKYYYRNCISCNGKNPEELFKEKGYSLFRCNNNDDIRKFLKYYSSYDTLCTSKDPNRIKNCHIFFAIKDNAGELIRNSNPVKEDEYDLSLLCIQISKHDNSITIISRYNDSVPGSIADCTFNNNLDNLIEGLNNSFKEFYKIPININYNYKDILSIDGYTRIKNKFYKPCFDLFGYGYCNENIIIDKLNGGKVIDTYKDKEKYVFMDYYILDLVNKKVILFDENNIKDSFLNTINEYDIDKIEIRKNKETKTKDIIISVGNENIIITISKENRIIKYINPKVEIILSHFMPHNNTLEVLSLPNLKESSRDFLSSNRVLRKVDLPKLEKWESYTFLVHPVFRKQFYVEEEEFYEKGIYK